MVQRVPLQDAIAGSLRRRALTLQYQAICLRETSLSANQQVSAEIVKRVSALEEECGVLERLAAEMERPTYAPSFHSSQRPAAI